MSNVARRGLLFTPLVAAATASGRSRRTSSPRAKSPGGKPLPSLHSAYYLPKPGARRSTCFR